MKTETIYLMGGHVPYCRVGQVPSANGEGYGVVIEICEAGPKGGAPLIFTAKGARQLEAAIRRFTREEPKKTTKS